MTLQIDDLFGLNGKVALVRGGGRGLGKMIAEGFISAGDSKVYIASRNAAALNETAADISDDGRCIALPADLSTEAGCKALAAEIAARESKLISWSTIPVRPGPRRWRASLNMPGTRCSS